MPVERRCRLCGAGEFHAAVTLADMPVTHTLRRRPDDPDPRFTLRFDACERCGLLQITEPIAADILYAETDAYLTGFQKPRHLDDLITTALCLADPGPAIDVGCNDGSLMEALRRYGYGPVVGIEPNGAAAALARDKGFPVHRGFLTVETAAALVGTHGAFGIAYVRHVIEHVDDLAPFFAALRILLHDDGLLVVELPRVEAGLRCGNPAILWEEHVSYFTEEHALHLIERYGFEVLERRRYAFGGGAIAFIARKLAQQPQPVPAAPDARAPLAMIARFAGELERYRSELRAVIKEARRRGLTVAMYGAAPRSCVVAAACGIGGDIDVVIDDRSEIQGRLMPGTQLTIEGLEAACARTKPHMLCLLGVGAESEARVRARLAAQLRQVPICISLFAPRNTLESIARAAHDLARLPPIPQ